MLRQENQIQETKATQPQANDSENWKRFEEMVIKKERLRITREIQKVQNQLSTKLKVAEKSGSRIIAGVARTMVAALDDAVQIVNGGG